MQRLKNLAVLIAILALVALPLTTSSHNQNNPSRSQAKLRKVKNKIPNRYIVVLNDDVASDDSPREDRLERVREIANSHALAHLGRVDYLYETALKGYAIELPNEAAAVAISKRPEVQWVEEDDALELGQAPASPQPSPPWGLDSIDGNIPAPTPDATGRTTGTYSFNATGAGVIAYVLDSGINTAHQDFQFPARATQAADCIRFNNCVSGAASPFLDGACGSGLPNTINNDCLGHGTHVAGILGGNRYGVAKAVTIRSVKVCRSAGGPPCPASAIIAGVNWVKNDHLANSGPPTVANMSIYGSKFDPVNPPFSDPAGISSAVNNGINSGTTYVVIAGNEGQNAANFIPADVDNALTVGAVDFTGTRPGFSNWGPRVDIWAPGVQVLSAQASSLLGGNCAIWNGSNTSECYADGTSMAGPHVAGAVALYLQGRTGLGGTVCASFPINVSVLNSTANANFSTCPDRVARFIKATSNLSRLTGVTVDANFPSPNKFLWSIWAPTNANPVDNQRFFVWGHYRDFLGRDEPDEGGLDHWTNNITGPCGTNINQNNACTREWRIHTSRAFWVFQFPTLFNPQTGGTTDNALFVHKLYEIYLRRFVSDTDSGFQHWLGDLNQYGNPASYDGVNHMIDAFLVSPEYRRRFGPS
jgi:subtilisin family serine protease